MMCLNVFDVFHFFLQESEDIVLTRPCIGGSYTKSLYVNLYHFCAEIMRIDESWDNGKHIIIHH